MKPRYVCVGAALLATTAMVRADVERLEIPFGRGTQLRSPGGSYILVERGQAPNPSLWLRDSRSGREKLILNVASTASAGWSRDGAAFYVQDDESSDSTLSYIYEAATARRMDIRERVLATYPDVKTFAAGHAYFKVRHWVDSQNVLISFEGHTDRAPVICFSIGYTVSRGGRVTEVSRRTGPPDAPWCR
jgi:hypothetical protein